MRGDYIFAVAQSQNEDVQLFSSSPRLDCSSPTPSQFKPDEPSCVPGSAAIWQYAEGCFQDPDYPRGLCDMDIANKSGYATMWSFQG